MRHARTDYNGRIVDTEPDDAKRIGEDEPVFLLRGTDLAAPTAIRQWAQTARKLGADDFIVETARRWASHMQDWQTARQQETGKIHVPDMPEGAEFDVGDVGPCSACEGSRFDGTTCDQCGTTAHVTASGGLTYSRDYPPTNPQTIC